MKVICNYTVEELMELTRQQFHQLWFNEALTDRQIAKMYCAQLSDVKAKRKELGLNWFNSAFLFIMGGSQYKNNKKRN